MDFRTTAEQGRTGPAWLRELPFAAVALLASAAFALSFGISYGVDNQSMYMIDSLRLLDPSVLRRDWYASVPSTHGVFGYVGWALLALDRKGFWVGVAQVPTIAAGMMSLYWLARVLYEQRMALASFLFVLALSFVTRTNSVAISYAFNNAFQASSLASMLLMASFAPFVTERYLLSGVLLALGGLLHANYLILGIGAFGFAHLCLGRSGLLRRLLEQLGPSLLVLAILAPTILAAVGSPDGPRAQDIQYHVRGPHHYSPLQWKPAFYSVAAYQMLGAGVGAWLLRGGQGRGRRLGVLLFTLSLVLWAGTALTTLVQVGFVLQLFVWRFAPYHSMLFALLFCAAAVHVTVQPSRSARISGTGLALSLAGLVSLGLVERGGNDAVFALLLAAVPALLSLAVWHAAKLAEPPAVLRGLARHAPWLVVLVALVACYRTGRPQVEQFRARSTLLNEDKSALHQLMEWARLKTPKDALFSIPPGLERFRLEAERAVIVDWKGSPYRPGDVLEWYRRLEDVCGHKGFRRHADVDRGYAKLDAARARTLLAKYHFDYLVVEKVHERDLPPDARVYRNAKFSVFRFTR